MMKQMEKASLEMERLHIERQADMEKMNAAVDQIAAEIAAQDTAEAVANVKADFSKKFRAANKQLSLERKKCKETGKAMKLVQVRASTERAQFFSNANLLVEEATKFQQMKWSKFERMPPRK